MENIKVENLINEWDINLIKQGICSHNVFLHVLEGQICFQDLLILYLEKKKFLLWYFNRINIIYLSQDKIKIVIY